MNNIMPPKSVYQESQTPDMLGEAYRPMGKTDFQFKEFSNDESKVEDIKSFISAFNYNYLYYLYYSFGPGAVGAESLDVRVSPVDGRLPRIRRPTGGKGEVANG